jgi:hypothetical protein
MIRSSTRTCGISSLTMPGKIGTTASLPRNCALIGNALTVALKTIPTSDTGFAVLLRLVAEEIYWNVNNPGDDSQWHANVCNALRAAAEVLHNRDRESLQHERD